LGLVGTPPTAVFLGKLEAFSAAFDGGYAWLVVLAAVNTVASLFYYLRWIVPAVSRSGPAGPSEGDRAARVVAYAAAAVSLGLGLAGGPVLEVLAGTSAQ
jgi:NADH-quinone oxidoreductase subunit N